jgi:hypothetical protein
MLSAVRAHTKAPYKPDLLREMLRALNKEGGPGPCVVLEDGLFAPLPHLSELPPFAENDRYILSFYVYGNECMRTY